LKIFENGPVFLDQQNESRDCTAYAVIQIITLCASKAVAQCICLFVGLLPR